MAGPYVIVFGRSVGPVKTRLAATIGAETARAMYDEMALTTFLVADRCDWTKRFYTNTTV